LSPTVTKEVSKLQNKVSARVAALTRRDTESLRNVRREFSRRLAKAAPELIVALALNLTRSSDVPRFLAYELVQHHREALKSLKARALEDLAQGNNSWEQVDAFACYLAGPSWREQQVSDALIRR
jgi:hypothetical protein